MAKTDHKGQYFFYGIIYLLVDILYQGSHAMWLWFENMNSRWCFYGSEINKTLESTYREGEPVAR